MENYFSKRNQNHGFSFDIDDIEFGDCFSYVTPQTTRLPFDIIVDSEKSYAEFGHAMCLYVVCDDKHRVIPITISYKPVIVGNDNDPRLQKVVNFIKRNDLTLTRYAEGDMSSPEFYRTIRRSVLNNMVNKMGVIEPSETGLHIEKSNK